MNPIKTQFNSKSTFIAKAKTMVILCLGLMASGNVAAQWRPNGKNFFVGVETVSSTRSFTITSDQKNLSGAHVLQGRKYAVVFGNRFVTGKVRMGDYTSNQKEAPFKANGYELISNFQPLQFLEEKPRLLEPYFTFSLEGTTIHTSGTYTPPPAEKSTGNASGSGSTCSCTCPNLPPSPPTPKPDPGPVTYSGKVVTTRGNVGVGLKLHIEKAHVFFNVFTEFKYGIALGNYSSTEALLSTYSLAQKGVDVGVSMGFVKNKSLVSRLRRTRFR